MVILLVGIAAMIVALVRHQRGKEARLAAQSEIEIPIESVWRAVLVVLPLVVAGPVLVGVLAAVTDPWMRHHALAATLTGIGSGVAGLWIGVRSFRGFRRIGLLRLTPDSLDLELGEERHHLALDEPYELDEGMATTGFGPATYSLQVVLLRQDGTEWGFSYMLPATRRPYGNRVLDRHPGPALSGEVRVIHDRLRAKLGAADAAAAASPPAAPVRAPAHRC